MEKSLARKLKAIHADPSGCREFIIADAKDADMAFGIGAPGLSPEKHDGELRFRTLAEYREQMRIIVKSELVDIMLMSASTAEVLAIHERLFENSPVTPAARANDTTDIHVLRGGKGYLAPSAPFRTASIDQMQCGHLDCSPEERHLGANLGLYSITFNNDMELDRRALEEFKLFREEAERKGFTYFLEVFDPNVPNAVAPELLGKFVNDAVARALAGVTGSGRPQFLKIAYHGPQAMEELVAYDPHLVVGILGGSAGTTLDAFQLIHDAKKYGGRVALFGRKINQAEHQLAFVHFLRLIADEVIGPVEAVKAYHGVLQQLNIRPNRRLEDDLVILTGINSYGSNGTISVPPPAPVAEAPAAAAAPVADPAPPVTVEPPVEAVLGEPVPEPEPKKPVAASKSPTNARYPGPNFEAMTSAERLEYHRNRLKQQFGS